MGLLWIWDIRSFKNFSMDYSKNGENSKNLKNFRMRNFQFFFFFVNFYDRASEFWVKENLIYLIWFVNILKKMKNSTLIYLLREYDSNII